MLGQARSMAASDRQRRRARQPARRCSSKRLQGVIERHLARCARCSTTSRRRELWDLHVVRRVQSARRPLGLNAATRLLLRCVRQRRRGARRGKPQPRCMAGARECVLEAATARRIKTVTKKSGFPTTHPEREGANAGGAAAELASGRESIAHLGALAVCRDRLLREMQWAILEALLAVLPLAVAELQLVFRRRAGGLHRSRCARCRRWAPAMSRRTWRWRSTTDCRICWSTSSRTRRSRNSICWNG